MYVYTTIIAAAFGMAEILAPARVQSMFDMPAQDPVVFGLSGSVFLALGLVAILGVRAPLKYCPVLLVELAYKLITKELRTTQISNILFFEKDDRGGRF